MVQSTLPDSKKADRIYTNGSKTLLLSARLAVKLGMLRNQKGWTQKQAAIRAEIGMATYQNLEEAKPTANPTLKVLEGLAGAYEVKFEELFIPKDLLLRNVSH